MLKDSGIQGSEAQDFGLWVTSCEVLIYHALRFILVLDTVVLFSISTTTKTIGALCLGSSCERDRRRFLAGPTATP
jgi:hypothetical protein